MRLYRITSCDHVHDLSGEGAFLYGGRWNSPGTRLLYTAEHAALAMLEALAHITLVNQKRAYCKLVLDLHGVLKYKPSEESEKPGTGNWWKEVMVGQLPSDWRSTTPPDSLKEFGDAFIKEGVFLALKVPSVLEPDSYNYLLNPEHPDFAGLKILHSERVSFDQRLLKNQTW